MHYLCWYAMSAFAYQSVSTIKHCHRFGRITRTTTTTPEITLAVIHNTDTFRPPLDNQPKKKIQSSSLNVCSMAIISTTTRSSPNQPNNRPTAATQFGDDACVVASVPMFLFCWIRSSRHKQTHTHTALSSIINVCVCVCVWSVWGCLCVSLCVSSLPASLLQT